MDKTVLLFLLGSLSVLAQPFTAGIKAGLPVTDFLDATQDSGYSASTQRYIIGGEAELRLPLGLGVEVDALYRHLHYDGLSTYVVPFTGLAVLVPNRTTGGNWEFPLLLKYRFRSRVARPYLDAGIAWDALTGIKQTYGAGGGAVPLSAISNPMELKRNTTEGFVIGAGVDVHLLLHISPEIRFTRWDAAQINATGGISSNLNQVEFLVGLTF